MEPFEKTYAMIKPDAVAAGKAEEICQLIEVHGFTIVSRQKLQVLIGSSFAVALYHPSALNMHYIYVVVLLVLAC